MKKLLDYIKRFQNSNGEVKLAVTLRFAHPLRRNFTGENDKWVEFGYELSNDSTIKLSPNLSKPTSVLVRDNNFNFKPDGFLAYLRTPTSNTKSFAIFHEHSSQTNNRLIDEFECKILDYSIIVNTETNRLGSVELSISPFLLPQEKLILTSWKV